MCTDAERCKDPVAASLGGCDAVEDAYIGAEVEERAEVLAEKDAGREPYGYRWSDGAQGTKERTWPSSCLYSL